MSLPFFNSSLKNHYEPIFKNLYEANFISDEISNDESIMLSDNILSIEHDEIVFNSTYPMNKILYKLNNFDLIIKLFNKNGRIHSIYEYKKCNIINKEFSFLDFSYSTTGVSEISIKFKFYDFKPYFHDGLDKYYRIKKLKNIIK